jgi:hypothetical protein
MGLKNFKTFKRFCIFKAGGTLSRTHVQTSFVMPKQNKSNCLSSGHKSLPSNAKRKQ